MDSKRIDDAAARIEAALARIAAYRPPDVDRAARLELKVKQNLELLDALIAELSE